MLLILTPLAFCLVTPIAGSKPMNTSLLSDAKPISPGRKGCGKSTRLPRLCCILDIIILFSSAKMFSDIEVFISFVCYWLRKFFQHVKIPQSMPAVQDTVGVSF